MRHGEAENSTVNKCTISRGQARRTGQINVANQTLISSPTALQSCDTLGISWVFAPCGRHPTNCFSEHLANIILNSPWKVLIVFDYCNPFCF